MRKKKPPVITGESAKKLRMFYTRVTELHSLLGMVSQRFLNLTKNDVLPPRHALLVRFLTNHPDFNLSAPSFAKTYKRLNEINPQLTPGMFAVMLGFDAQSAERLMVDNKMRPVTASFLRLIDQQLSQCNNKAEKKKFYTLFYKNFIEEMKAREMTVEVQQFLNSGDWFRHSNAEGTGRKSKSSNSLLEQDSGFEDD